ncbi:MAG: hypothetical protein A3C82_01575 [Candidatus Wildermuthbacteria bacterium RIFCSPHIGHO2_02_FULL_47_12]|uniref:Uncharacterized protein n=1 Tax=Candidatus Wildermuthbacteria bacterium RIFCSPHIGHO2_02_FULL_47_12 TaxID=1802451 RepID=A0A1G2R225_9BACT|nr:MAG: hypothetical protein A3C82_01575 [Candidatus Wildermuthbacteria bacterium RIFCSPHIGHO2_02_FULL_47_12]
MAQEFITIAEAVRLTGKSDVELMRFLKDRMESDGISIESITRKEQRGSRVLYVISKTFLLRELAKTKQPKEGVSQEIPQEQQGVEEPTEHPKVETPVVPDALLGAKDEMIGTLQKIIETKDRQMDSLSKKIDELIERDRETNFLLKGLQDRIFLLEGSQRNTAPESKKEEPVKTEKQRK